MFRKLVLLTLLIISVLGIAALNYGHVTALGNILPDAADSQGGADIMLANANTRYVRQTNGKIRVWFPNNNGSVEIRFGNFCSGVRGDYVESEDGSYGQWANGANITRFRIPQTGQEWFGRKGVNCNASHTFNFNNITTMQNGYYYRDIDIDYVGGRQNPFSGAVNNYLIAAPGQPNAIIGLPGDDSGHQLTQDQVNGSPRNTDYRALFGAPCNLDSPEQARIYMYDLDNAGGSGAQQFGDVTIRLFDRTSGNYVQFDNSSHSGNPGTTWRPANLQNDKQWVAFTARPDHKYRMEVNNVYNNNTIQWSLPYAQIFSEPCHSARIVPRATVNGSATNITVPLGTALTFRNFSVTSDLDGTGSDTFRQRVAVTDAPMPGGGVAATDYQIAGARDVPNSRNQFSFTPTVAGRYCRETRISNYPSYVETPQGATQQVCARVTDSTPTGNITPAATLNASEYEVGGSATGTVAYTSDFTMPTPTTSQGVTLQEYRGPYLNYTSRMWYDDGSETYPATGDVETNNDTQTQRQISGGPVTNANLNTWPRSPLVLQPHSNPNFKICVSMQISDAYYEQRTRSVTPAGAPTAWSAWSRVDIGYDDQITTTCAPIYRYPSLRVVNGDIKIGGVFKQGLTACERTVTDLNNHAIVGHAHAVEGTLRGSKGQYGVLALGRIANFGSNNLLATQAGSTTLTFANAGGTLGEFFGTATGTIPTSCFNETYTAYPVAAESSSGSATLGATGNTNTTHRLNGSGDTLTITGGTVGAGERRIIRVTGSGGGTVVLNGNISFAPVGNIDQIPQFILLVEAPNVDIRVASGVTTLSGLYVTQGSFATCHEFNGSTTSPNIHIDSGSPCYNALTVKGAVITGKSVLPYRTNAASTTYSDPAEIVDLNGTILISDYARKQQTGNFMTIGQMELPPRF